MNRFKKMELSKPSVNILSAEAELKGDILLLGDLRIDGKLYGNIHCEGKLTVGTSGYIEGQITCFNAEIAGEIKGTIGSSGLIILKNSSKFAGDINTKSIMVELGATVSMICKTDKSYETNKDTTDSLKNRF